MGKVKRDDLKNERMGNVKRDDLKNERMGNVKRDDLKNERMGKVKRDDQKNERMGNVKRDDLKNERMGNVKRDDQKNERMGKVKRDDQKNERMGNVKRDDQKNERIGKVKRDDLKNECMGNVKRDDLKNERMGKVKRDDLKNERIWARSTTIGMRVLEADPSILYKMVKNKKHRIRKAKENDVDDSSDDGQLSGCPHITKAVNINTVRKAITRATISIDECVDCAREGPKSVTRDLFGGVIEGAAADGDEAENIPELTICVCLQCGHQGCDRNSANKHALKHYKTPHTGLHCIILNLTTWSTWCYACDDVVPVNARVQGCIDYLQKMCGVRINKPDLPLSSTVKATEMVATEASSLPVNSSSSKSSNAVSCAKVKGLSNLGNTCFFNAVMQSMCQTRGLENLLLERSKQEKMTILGPIPGYDSDTNSSDDERDEECAEKLKPLPTIQTSGGEPGPVTQALLGFMQEMKGGSSRNGTVNPTALFTQVCKKAPRFKGFQQQDSHELLRYLIDSIRSEEIRKGQCSILKFFKLSETVNPKKVDDMTKMKIKQYGRQVKHTFLDSVFGGQLVSTIKCEECRSISQVYEAFLDLSLPVMEEKPQRPSITLIGKKKDSMCLNEDGDLAITAASNMGLDPCNDKPSKYQDRKNKRNAKKDAKKKAKSQKAKTYNLSQFANQDENNEKGSGDQENASEDSSSKAADGNESGDGKKPNDEEASQKEHPTENESVEKNKFAQSDEVRDTLNSSPEGSKEGLDTNKEDRSSSKDDPSDADIEDNLEGDQSHFVISVPNGSQDLESCDVSHQVTLSLPEKCELDIVRECSDVGKSVQDWEGIDSLTQSVEELRVQEKNLRKEDQLTRVKCEMFTVDTSVNNFSDFHQNGDEDLSIEKERDAKTDSDKENSLFSSQNSKLEKPEVSAMFNVSLPTVTVSQNISEGTNVNTISSSNLNAQKADSVKGRTESSEGEHQGDKKCSDDKSCLPLNGTKPRIEYLREAKQHSMNTLAPRYQPAPKECSVLSCLNQFTAAELLTGSNKVGCKSCAKNKSKNTAPQKEKKGKEMVYSNANKQYLIFRPPSVLTLHLKRFEQTGLTSRKVNRHVDFPLTLDLAPYCSSLCSGVKEGQSKVLYSLYGIVEHSGRLNGGHYTAYVKLRPGVTSHTQFLNMTPPSPQDILNIYMERIMMSKSQACGDFPGMKYCDGTDMVDKDVEALAESLATPGRWFHISDSRVNEVSEASVLKAQAYLLFYERIF